MADLQFFGFVLTFFTVVEGSLTNKASSIYSSGRKRVPQNFDGALERVEEFVASYYSPAREWLEEKGSTALVALDELAARSYKAAKAKFAACVPESASEAHAYWVKKLQEVSSKWKEQGVLMGSMDIFKEVLDHIRNAVVRVGNIPIVSSVTAQFKNSEMFTTFRKRFAEQVQPLLSAMWCSITEIPESLGERWRKLRTWTDAAIEKVDSVTDCVVRHPLYSKGVSVVGASIDWLRSTVAYSKFIDNLYVPYLGKHIDPVAATIGESKVYKIVVNRLTPVKQD